MDTNLTSYSSNETNEYGLEDDLWVSTNRPRQTANLPKQF